MERSAGDLRVPAASQVRGRATCTAVTASQRVELDKRTKNARFSCRFFRCQQGTCLVLSGCIEAWLATDCQRGTGQDHSSARLRIPHPFHVYVVIHASRCTTPPAASLVEEPWWHAHPPMAHPLMDCSALKLRRRCPRRLTVVRDAPQRSPADGAVLVPPPPQPYASWLWGPRGARCVGVRVHGVAHAVIPCWIGSPKDRSMAEKHSRRFCLLHIPHRGVHHHV